MKTTAILLCAGTGSRMRGRVSDKILAELRDKPVFAYSLEAFEGTGEIDNYVVVYRDEPQRRRLEEIFASLSSTPVRWVCGGAERQESVFHALEETPENTDTVMIHDCARPLVTVSIIRSVLEAAQADKSAVLAHRVVDTIKEVRDLSQLRQARLSNLDRHKLWAMETPQAFAFKLIRGAYRKLREEGIQVTDDTAAVIHFDYPVTIVENPGPNPKITLPDDLAPMEFILTQRKNRSTA